MSPSVRCLTGLAVSAALFTACGSSGGDEPAQPAPFVTASAVAQGSARIRVYWSPTDLTPSSYDLYRSTVAGGLGTRIATSLSPSIVQYDDGGLLGATDYFYTVQATAGAAVHSSVQAKATTLPTATFGQPIAGLSATRSGGTVQLTWDAFQGATQYEIWRSFLPDAGSSGGVYFGQTYLGNVATTSFTDTALASDGTFYYTVYALDAGATQGSLATKTSITIPEGTLPGVAAPIQDFWASSRDATVVHFYWYASPSGTAHHVYAARDGNPVTPGQGGIGAALDGPPHNVPIREVRPGYFVMDIPNAVLVSLFGDGSYALLAVEATKGTARASSPVMGTPVNAPAPTTAPAGLVADVRSPSRVNLAWNPVAGASSYKVYRLGAPDAVIAGQTPVATVTGTSHSDTGLAAGATYFYRVTAATVSGESPASDHAQGRTYSNLPPVMLPPVPLGLWQALLTWGSANTGTTFKIYGGGAIVPTAIDPTNLVATTPPVVSGGATSVGSRIVSAPPASVAASLAALGLLPITGIYWVSEVYPDGSEGSRSVMPAVFLFL